MSATNSGFDESKFRLVYCLRTMHKEMKYESNRCPPIWRS